MTGRMDVSPGRRSSPIGIYETTTGVEIPHRIRYLAVVALSTIRDEWADHGDALRTATTAELDETERLLLAVADCPQLVPRLGKLTWIEAVGAARLVRRLVVHAQDRG